MVDRSLICAAHRVLGRCGARLRDIVTGASGLSAYEQYLEHLHAEHPGAQAMSREAFFRSDQAARWEGVRRCC